MKDTSASWVAFCSHPRYDGNGQAVLLLHASGEMGIKRQHERGLVRLAVVVAVVGVLAGWTLIANDGATSLRIIAWRSVADMSPSVSVSSVTYPVHFDKTYTDHSLVSEAQDLLDGASSLEGLFMQTSGGTLATVVYRYEFIFSTLGVPTQTYSGSNTYPEWSAVTYALWIPGVTSFPIGTVADPFWYGSPSTFWRRLGVPQGA